MKLPSLLASLIMGGALLAAVGIFSFEQMLPERLRPHGRITAILLLVAGFFVGLQDLAPSHEIGVDIAKGVIAGVAAMCVFYEAHRAGMRRPVSEKWKRYIGCVLGVAAIIAYFNGLRFGYHKYYHRWDQYHYYMGAKYFPELGYDGLYRCAVVAQDDLGQYKYTNEDTGRPLTVDMSKEVRHPDKKIRNLGGDNLLKPVAEILENPAQCRDLFTPVRWDAFKADVAFFRTSSDKGYWEDMQKDHGFNPPPVWNIAGKFLADLHPATTGYLQFLAALDIAYLLGMFAVLYWGFGWRVFAVGAIFWGCQSSAPYLWTGGAFLRQDWIFFLVLSAAFLRKKYFALGAAALVYAGLLRIFPGLVVVGWLGVVFWQLLKHKRLTKPQLRMLAGGTLAAAVLIPTSIYFSGKDSYKTFYEHTLKVHDQTPLTNHMGLRVLIGQKTPVELGSFGTGADSGRMKYTKNGALTDPFKLWKDMRNERYAKLKPVAYAIIALSVAFFMYVLRRVKNMWVAMCLAQVFVILLSQLTCYYYSFMILGAPLIKVKPLKMPIELSLFGLAILSQFAWRIFYWNDDKYWVLTLLSLIVCYGFLVAFAPSKLWHQIQDRFPFLKRWAPVKPAAQSSGASVGT